MVEAKAVAEAKTTSIAVKVGAKNVELDAKTFASGNVGYQAMGDISIGDKFYTLNFMLVEKKSKGTRKVW